MRWKTLAACTLILGISFSGGVLLGKNAATVLRGEEPLEEENRVVSNQNINVAPPANKEETATPKPTEKPSAFFLVLSDKEICVYELPPSGEAIFLYDTEVEIEQLRQEDYERLCRGIKVATLEEARALSEDFGS